MVKFIIEDEFHCEQTDPYPTLREAVDELRRRAAIPYDEEPNRCPCTSWRTCSRLYRIIEVDDSIPDAWKELSRVDLLDVSKAGAKWLRNPDSVDA